MPPDALSAQVALSSEGLRVPLRRLVARSLRGTSVTAVPLQYGQTNSPVPGDVSGCVVSHD